MDRPWLRRALEPAGLPASAPEGLAELGYALVLIPADAHPADTQLLGGIAAAQTRHASII